MGKRKRCSVCGGRGFHRPTKRRRRTAKMWLDQPPCTPCRGTGWVSVNDLIIPAPSNYGHADAVLTTLRKLEEAE